jgi:hypothetical protein
MPEYSEDELETAADLYNKLFTGIAWLFPHTESDPENPTALVNVVSRMIDAYGEMAEEHAKLCAALADLRDTALYPTPEDLPRDYVTMVETATSPLAVVKAAKHVILAARLMIDLQKMEDNE